MNSTSFFLFISAIIFFLIWLIILFDKQPDSQAENVERSGSPSKFRFNLTRRWVNALYTIVLTVLSLFVGTFCSALLSGLTGTVERVLLNAAWGHMVVILILTLTRRTTGWGYFLASKAAIERYRRG
jgi:hypothetical protein